MFKKKLLKRLVIGLVVLPILLITGLIAVLYFKQDAIVKDLLTKLNADFKGRVEVKDSHVSPFENFPYISIDLGGLAIYETKQLNALPIVKVNDLYLGFDLITILKGNMDVTLIKLSEGEIAIVQDTLGKFNILNAFEAVKPVESTQEEFHLNLKSLQLENIDITKINEKNKVKIDLFITRVQSRFKTSQQHVKIGIDTKFIVSVLKGGDSTFFKNKHVQFDTEIDYDKQLQQLTLLPSSFDLEKVQFDFDGSVDFKNDNYLKLNIKGHKPSFDIFLAFAPEELKPALAKYNNKGKIYFTTTVDGKIIENRLPKTDVSFICEDAYLQNSENQKKLDQLNFKAFFTTGEKGTPETMAFRLTDFTSRPEAGVFSGHLNVKNFDEPEVDTKIISDFDLDFLSKFIGVKDLEDLKGQVKLTMNFRDIIDLNHPEKAIEKLNESYFTELAISGLSFKSKSFHLPIDRIDVNATLKGHEAEIKNFYIKVGNTDLKISGSIDDLPAILHHKKDEVKSFLNIQSKFIDIQQLTSGNKQKKPFDEQIENLNLKLHFKSSAKAFTESPNLPVGEFFIDDLYAKMKHYPHTLHDFRADLFIDTSHFRIIDFSGLIDQSDFHFNGKLLNYDLWFMNESVGDTKVEFDLTSKLLLLHDVFSYNGANYVPEDYRHEELRDFKLHGNVAMHFNKTLQSTDLFIEQFTAQMKLHKYKFEKFKGRVHYEDEHLIVSDFFGKLGRSDFEMDLNYYLGKNEVIKKRDNHFGIKAKYLDMDELFSFNPSANSKTMTPKDHEKGFNIYELPFTDMTFDVDINHLNYHRYLIHDLSGKLRTTPQHYIYIDTLRLLAADGEINGSGYFNGSNKNKIYFSPNLSFTKIDIDKLLLKFENFGQDHFVSENIHGKLSGKLRGQLLMHRDLVPIIDQSELHIDMEVLEGKLEKYAPLTAMADYFKDKNVAKVLFDTLKNHIDMNKGVLSFPLMTINSSLGFIEVSGKQDMKLNMEYYIKVPMKLVTDVAKQKLFGRRKEDEPIDVEREDAIQYKDTNKKIRYVNLKLSGNSENYKISLVKNKDIPR